MGSFPIYDFPELYWPAIYHARQSDINFYQDLKISNGMNGNRLKPLGSNSYWLSSLDIHQYGFTIKTPLNLFKRWFGLRSEGGWRRGNVWRGGEMRGKGEGGKGRGGEGGTTSPDPSCLCEGSRVLSCWKVGFIITVVWSSWLIKFPLGSVNKNE